MLAEYRTIDRTLPIVHSSTVMAANEMGRLLSDIQGCTRLGDLPGLYRRAPTLERVGHPISRLIHGVALRDGNRFLAPRAPAINRWAVLIGSLRDPSRRTVQLPKCDSSSFSRT